MGSLAGLGALALFLLSVSVVAAPKLKVRIIQTNAAGDNLHIIDPETNKVVGVISGIEVGHGVAVAKDGSAIYVSDEGKSTLDVVDAKTLKVAHEFRLSGASQQYCSHAGRKAFVCRDRATPRGSGCD